MARYTDAETGFVYLRARYYDPATGQFISRDPPTAVTGSPYGYAYGNPLNTTDPTGLDAFVVVIPGSWGGPLTTPPYVDITAGKNIDYPMIDLAGGRTITPFYGGTDGGRLVTPPFGGDGKICLSAGPLPSPNVQPPTNAPQDPPTVVPAGWRVRVMAPTAQYPDGYWKLDKPMKDGSWKPIDPSTMKPGTRPETHVPLPPKQRP